MIALLNSIISVTHYFKNIAKKVSETAIFLSNTIVLTIVYIIGIGTTSLISKLLGKHFLNLKKRPVQTHWITKPKKITSLNDNTRQF